MYGRTYKDGVLNGESYLKYTDGSIETRQYKNGVLQGEVICEKMDIQKYMYNNGLREEKCQS